MNLSNKEKKVVENEILYRIGSGWIPTKIVIDDVFSGNSIPGCKNVILAVLFQEWKREIWYIVVVDFVGSGKV